MAAYAVAATTMVVLILGAASLARRGSSGRLGALHHFAPRVKRWGGWLLVVVGTWFLTLSAFSRTFEQVFSV